MNLFPRNVLDRVRIIDTREVAHQWYEICATGLATYDEETGRMTVQLDGFLRRVQLRGKDELSRPPWLAPRESVSMTVSREEATDAAGEVFDAWAKRVTRSIPNPSAWQPDAPWLSLETKSRWPVATRELRPHAFSGAFS
jgi:hypothetical protein